MTGLFEFIRDHLGQDLYRGQTEVLSQWIESGRHKVLLCLGRRSGKGLMAACVAIYNAAIEDYSPYFKRRERRYIIVVANSLQQAGEFILRVRELLEAALDEDLVQLVDWEACTQTQIVFRNDVVIRAMPTSDRSTRGLAISLLILDEAGHFQTESEGVGAGRELYRALSPAVAQFGPKGYVMFTSTPHWRSGLFWEQYRNATELGRDGKPLDESLLVIQRPTWEMNPTFPRDCEEIANNYLVDPDSAATEWGADFSTAEGAFLDPKDILAAKRETGTLAPVSGTSYRCAIDPAFQKDAFAMAIAHKEADSVVFDGVWVWHRQGFENTLDQVVSIAKRYSVRSVRTDQFSSQSVLEGLQKRHLECDVVPWDNANKFEAFTRLKAGLATRQLSLPNDDQIVQELMNLEARPTLTGMVRIAASAGNHDDRATVIAALCDMLEADHGPIVITWRDWRPDAVGVASDNPFDSLPLYPD